jgi:glucose/arabinose dehydrogenase
MINYFFNSERKVLKAIIIIIVVTQSCTTKVKQPEEVAPINDSTAKPATVDSASSGGMEINFGSSDDNMPAPTISQSAEIIKLKEAVKITADISELDKDAKPEVKINDKIVELGKDGSAKLDVVPKQTGNQQIPVSISFTKPNGERTTKNIQ